MLKALRARLRQGYWTGEFPKKEPKLPDRFRGLPKIERSRCPVGCEKCKEACPTDAIQIADDLRFDLGRCLFCHECTEACPEGAIAFTSEYRLAAPQRSALVLDPDSFKLGEALSAKIQKKFGKSLGVRVVSAGGCNACEADINVLTTLVFDLSRFGIHYVASPRHADAMIVAGPVPENMREAVRGTYDAIPTPRFVLAVGACAISGGPFIDNPEIHNGTDAVVPVDYYIPGCPPHPYTILDGILRAIGKRKEKS